MPDILGDISFTWPFWLGALLAYLVGSIPFGLLLTRMAGLGDIRSIGSGNIGATNVLRTGRKGVALATLILDGAKGTLAVVGGPLRPGYGRDRGGGGDRRALLSDLAQVQRRQGRGDRARHPARA